MTDGAFNMPWGTRVRVVRAPDSCADLQGATGTLTNPKAVHPHEVPGVVALLHVGKIHWSIHTEGWGFESIEQPGADVRVALRTEWTEFATRCSDNISRIHDTRDDGVYAKLYAADVSRLLKMLQGIERSAEGRECVSDAWEDAK